MRQQNSNYREKTVTHKGMRIKYQNFHQEHGIAEDNLTFLTQMTINQV